MITTRTSAQYQDMIRVLRTFANGITCSEGKARAIMANYPGTLYRLCLHGFLERPIRSSMVNYCITEAGRVELDATKDWEL